MVNGPAVYDPLARAIEFGRAFAAREKERKGREWADLYRRDRLAVWTSGFGNGNGYSEMVEWILRALEWEGVNATFYTKVLIESDRPASDYIKSRLCNDRPNSPVLKLMTPASTPVADLPNAIATMWETTRISPLDTENLNRYRVVIVPCAFCRDSFRASGVTVPIHVVPLGLDPTFATTRPLPPPGAPFTIGMAGKMAHGGIRKGLSDGMAAFVAAFPSGSEPVRLVVKVWPSCVASLTIPDDPRIEINTASLTKDDLAVWYGRLDVLFVPSKGEGWGMHTHQAMGCGRPVIAADWSGTREFWRPDCGWSLPFEMLPSREMYRGNGEWAVPTEAGMVDALCAAFTAGRDECRRRGAIAADRARAFTWERTGRELAAVLRAHGMIPRG